MLNYSSNIIEPEIDKDKLYIYLDKNCYMIDEEAKLTVINFSGSDLIMRYCGFRPDLEIERNINNIWLNVIKPNPFINIKDDSIVITKGSIYSENIIIPNLKNGNNYIAGIYRFKLYLFKEDNKQMLKDNMRASKPFNIVTALRY